MPEKVEIDAVVRDDHAFGAQAKPLFEAGFAGEQDAPARTEHAVPRHTFTGSQCPDDLAGGTGMAAGGGDIAVSRDLALWDAADCAEDVVEHLASSLSMYRDPDPKTWPADQSIAKHPLVRQVG